jgi:hypothetical protein
MKHNIRYTCTTIAIAGMLLGGFALAAEKKASGQKLDPEMEKMMMKAEVAGTPGAAHKALEPLVGNWSAAVKCWMAPDAPPTVTKGKATSKWVMKGRFVQEEFDGEFMGKPFRGMSLTGYDNLKQKYTVVWVDDTSTAMVTSEGVAAEDGKTITLEGKFDCPMTDEKDVGMKQVIRVVSQDKHIFEMHDLRKGDNSMVMEITYTRK